YTVHSRAEQLLTGLGFTQAQMHLPLTIFSGGWRMRLALARALMLKPEILLLDEPFSALDFEMTLFIREKLQEVFMQTGTTMLLVSHDLEEAV
ncbi:ATP-binding cassette domain-containing protein, partial [Escherichia coli]|uniref:ATP-binding cassette domain-containing protein n=1 Tax=Escherichia coli TaxID=562 RepID=UPI002283624B